MGNKTLSLHDILNEFRIEEEIIPYGNGHINDTYYAGNPTYIIQKINTSVFENPDELMSNIENVTEFLKKKIIKNGGNPLRETLTVIKTKHGKNYYKYDDENVFRVYYFIKQTKTVENSSSPDDLYNAGKGFGRFQNFLNDFPIETLYETIADFHNTPKRLENFKQALAEDKVGRASLIKEEIDFVLNNEGFASAVVEGIARGDIPLRVTHNDTKINNLLFDEHSGEAVCVIDLDTVMPGSILYDFGDALRIGGSTAAEDETDLTKVHFDTECFKAFAKGFLGETKSVLTPKEIELIPMSPRLMTFECGVRFLTDFLNGDTYFKTHRENHNLDRARNQFKLCRELAQKEEELRSIINKII